MNKRKLGFMFLVLFVFTLVLSSQISSPALCLIDNQLVTKITSVQPGNYDIVTDDVEIGFMEYGAYDGSGGSSAGVAIGGEIVYVANGNQGLEIINISNPTKPRKIANILTQGDAVDVLIYGTMAYVSQKFYGVALINISNPATPVLKSTITPGGDALEVSIHANILRIATANNGLNLYEVSNPSNPLFISRWKGNNELSGSSVITKYNCLAAKEGGLEIVDQTFPADPYLVGSWNDSSGIAFGVDSIAIDDCKYAFLAYGLGGLIILNFTNPKTPEKIAEYTFSNVIDVTVVDSYAFLSCKNYGLVILDISDLENPVELSVYDTPGFCLDAARSGDIAVIADEEDGIQILSISTPANPIMLSQFLGFGKATRVVIRDELAYIVDYYKGLEIYDISDPSEPYKIGYFDNNNDDEIYAFDLTLSGDIAIISAYEDGVLFVNIADPENPFLVNSYYDGSRVHCTAINEDIVFVAGLNRTIVALNVSDIANLSVEGTYDFPSPHPYVYSLLYEDDILYAGTTLLGLYSLNVSDVSAITKIDDIASTHQIRDIYKKDNLLFAAVGGNGFKIYNTSGTELALIAEMDTEGYAYEISLFGNMLFVADGYYGLKVFNVSDLQNPIFAGKYTKHSFYGVKHFDQYIIGGIGFDGVLILALDSDRDSISDIDEINIYGTNPYNSDTDSDGASDDFEILYGLDPLDPTDGSQDPDQDGLTNAEESELLTNPFEEDTDQDGMPDGFEAENRLDPLFDDSQEDIDNDHLSNYEEYLIGTDPRDDDTDRDDFEDGLEVIYGTDPLNEKDNPYTRKIKRIIATSSIGIVLIATGIFFIVKTAKKRIARNREREQQLLQEEQEKVLIF